ncbi:SOS response-associated peptidase family protein [Glacieibacterium frigidum]|uniref:SOS response-associated peptidase n=1 Tax=Glacieibacterium frigidum TaxID=2593303 RepID=A0A552UIM9_9SPHN|nr:SOS response-associated peptidase family protein [Glacieibacterium frigidum]TRW18086.1 SOS response-associated peptidase [Glacieibacterium frigidum]
MCNEAARRTALGLMREDFNQVRIELTFPEGLPNLGESPSIRITDTTVIVRAAGETAEMVQRRWSWVGPGGKPVYNYRSEGRRFGNAATGGRCLIPLDGFYEFTDAQPPLSLDAGASGPSPAKRRGKKDKWLFSLNEQPEGEILETAPECKVRKVRTPRAAPGLFCVAGLWRADADLGKAGRGEAWTMLTCEPGPDIAPYHGRQIVIMPRDRWADWLAGVVPAADLIAPTPAGTLTVARAA